MTSNEKPYSQASENNKLFILPILQKAFKTCTSVLEIGSGTGQHAVYFAKELPKVTWQTSDLLVNHAGIKQWIHENPSVNLQLPITLDLVSPWPIEKISAIYTANTLHIISLPLVERFFEGVKKHLAHEGKLCIYGPFKYKGQYTSESNASFDIWLKERNIHSGIRDIEYIIELANEAGLTLLSDHAMPANNRLLEFIKQ